MAEEVETISVKARIPLFWRDQPTLWFGQFETVVNPQKPNEEAKFSLMVAHLEKADVEQISDIVMSKTRTGRYEEAKKRLLSVYEESETKQLHKLLNEMELGDQKPSQLLRRMREPAREKMPDSTLQMLWLQRLPTSTRAVLAVSEQKSLDVLAAMADKMHDQATEIQTVCSCTCQGHTKTSSPPRAQEQKTHRDEDLRAAVMQLTREIAELKVQRTKRMTHGHRRFVHSRSRSRSRSAGRNHKYDHKASWASDACYFHQRFGEKARNCRSPCNFNKRQEN
ncbi:hypothetical protein PYW07_015743 [Mythimna separata]|uniref:DUF7041 domain-containing protein n=1 Tax=Mythimna separata TaxID=271217 RepID=A0AAD7YRB8_MYTSE|nr:hypothetical protein PYW07_003860 [Mythimna separata]KAJ8724785.1 hypothetical protein PYW07_015743 [Mythimna separata]